MANRPLMAMTSFAVAHGHLQRQVWRFCFCLVRRFFPTRPVLATTLKSLAFQGLQRDRETAEVGHSMFTVDIMAPPTVALGFQKQQLRPGSCGSTTAALRVLRLSAIADAGQSFHGHRLWQDGFDHLTSSSVV